MDLHCPHLDLSPYWAGEDDNRRIIVVPAIDAIRPCGARGAYERADEWETVWALMDRRTDLGWQIRRFALDIRLLSPYGTQTSDDDVFLQIIAAIERRALVGLRRNRAVVAVETEPTRIERQLIRNIESQTRGRLSEAGRHYKLVAGADLPGIPDRDRYEVVRHDDARNVLDAIAKQSAGQTEVIALLGKARDTLSPDWRPPLGPKGLVLVRKIAAPRAAATNHEPAITPSQMREMMEKATLEIHVVDLNRKPQDGLAFKIAMPDGGTVDGKLDKDGRGRAKSSTPGMFTVTFPDLDGADWDGDGALDLPPEEKRSEASRFKVEQGDRLPTIARKMGFARWETIWDFVENATLKELRGNAYVLFPGDEVSIPSKLARVAEVQGGTAEYVVRSAAEVLRVRFAEADLGNIQFKATPDKGEATAGTLESDGTMEIMLPAQTMKVDVDLFRAAENEPFLTCRLEVGHLDPDNEVSGIQGRLANLGYYAGPIDGAMNDATREAIIRFNLVESGDEADAVDDSFTEALGKAHEA